MILSTLQKDRHVEDGDLIRLRDGECPYSEEREIREHLAVCTTCSENAERIDQLAEGFLSAVDEIQHPAAARLAPERTAKPTPVLAWYRRRAWRVAAVVAAVLALSLTTAPVRALAAAGWRAVKTLFVGAPPAAPEPPQATSMVSFVPEGDAFLIDFQHTQSLGTLSVVIDTASAATAKVFGGDGLDEIIVLQAGLRVRNRTASSASYELRLPDSLRDIEVRIAGRTIAAFSTSGLRGGARWEVELTGNAGR